MATSKRKKSASKSSAKRATKTVPKSPPKPLSPYLPESDGFQEIESLDLAGKVKDVPLGPPVEYTLHWFILVDGRSYKESAKVIKKAGFDYKGFILQGEASVMDYGQKKGLRIVKHSIRARVLQGTMKKTEGIALNLDDGEELLSLENIIMNMVNNKKKGIQMFLEMRYMQRVKTVTALLLFSKKKKKKKKTESDNESQKKQVC